MVWCGVSCRRYRDRGDAIDFKVVMICVGREGFILRIEWLRFGVDGGCWLVYWSLVRCRRCRRWDLGFEI